MYTILEPDWFATPTNTASVYPSQSKPTIVMNRFEGKTALVTGAASGIGRTTAQAFAAEGARVVVADVNAQGGNETVELIQQTGGQATFFQTDVSNADQVTQLIRNTIAQYDVLDIAINNAGIGGAFAPITHYKDAEWDKIIAINQAGVFYCMREQLKHMQERRSGVIINVSSIAGLKGFANASAYAASKHAVLGLTKSAALEAARYEVRVNAVCPVFTRSPLFDQMFNIDPSYEEKLKRGIPLRRYGQPEDIANAILWLSADGSDFVTGLCLPVDGGMMA